jgi:hypothetical protein
MGTVVMHEKISTSLPSTLQPGAEHSVTITNTTDCLITGIHHEAYHTGAGGTEFWGQSGAADGSGVARRTGDLSFI